MIFKRFLLVFLLIFVSLQSYSQKIIKEGFTVKKIWDQDDYNSFTDLIRFNHSFYCSFRVGQKHVSSKNKGKVRILRSSDGKNWESVALLSKKGTDLRDPKLAITPDHQIMVIMAGAVFDKDLNICQLYPVVSFSDLQGTSFSSPQKAALDSTLPPTKDWIWRINWEKKKGYGIDYKVLDKKSDQKTENYLLSTKDGIHFKKVSRLPISKDPNEATIRFKGKEMYALIRTGASDKKGMLAKSLPPYTDWTITPLNYRLGGSNFLFFDKNKLLVATRSYTGDTTSTSVYITDLSGRILKTLLLPSGGDTSYPGMVLFNHKLWISYYSSHEGKASIYLAKIPVAIL